MKVCILKSDCKNITSLGANLISVRFGIPVLHLFMNYWTIVFGAGLYVQTDEPVKTKKVL
jgi:hypothetical protein